VCFFPIVFPFSCSNFFSLSRNPPFAKLDMEQLQRDVSNAVNKLTQPSSSSSVSDLDTALTNLTQAFHSSYNAQGSSKWRGNHRLESWWDPDVLGTLAEACNQARMWMLLSNTNNTRRFDSITTTLFLMYEPRYRLGLMMQSG
ncbi:hypothetical protein VP01_11868g1, partial [Puccinia sorghi]